jgi:lysophospholipase L1-like esterase
MKLPSAKFLLLISGIYLFISAASICAHAQDPARFKSEVESLVTAKHDLDPSEKKVVFAGSSSVRMWKDVPSYYLAYNVINNGFGGSHFSDLLFYYNELILRFTPDILFLYEGDNDIASGKEPAIIAKEAKTLIKRIRKDLPQTRIIIISPKPSVARWNLKPKYEALNRELKKLAERNKSVEFADVWSAMLDQNGEVFRDIFLQDNLHMNKKGYDIWGKVIGEYLK